MKPVLRTEVRILPDLVSSVNREVKLDVYGKRKKLTFAVYLSSAVCPVE